MFIEVKGLRFQSLHLMVYARYVCGRNLVCCEMLNTIAKQVAILSESSIRTALITISHNVIRDPASCRGRLIVSVSAHHIGIHELRASVLVVSLRSVAIRLCSLHSGITGNFFSRFITTRQQLCIPLPQGYTV